VLAPHPDDESLMAAHVIASAVRTGRPIHVLVMTNGDLGCERDGWLRERETVAAMAVLGLPEDRIRFLGYPDGALSALGPIPLPPRERRTEDGACIRSNTTYGGHGEHRLDVHTALAGSPATYDADSAIGDLVALLEHDRPGDVYVSHPIDAHPDHATTYVLLRRALERARLERLPRIHRAVVHAGGCWPAATDPAEPCTEGLVPPRGPYPPLPEPLAAYLPTEHVPVSDHGSLGRRAIAEYHSQLHTNVDGDWLGTFSRAESVYWSEVLTRQGDRLVRARAQGVSAGQARELAPPSRELDHEVPASIHTTLSIAQRAPLRASFEAQVPERASVEIQLLARRSDPASGYRLAIRSGADVELRSGERVLRALRLPEDGAAHARHRWELRMDPRPDEGGVIEIELRRDGALLGVTVDARAYVDGDLATVQVRGGAEVAGLAVTGEP
jgi:LmbE family N-acetylglucosaminyl deacetylase